MDREPDSEHSGNSVNSICDLASVSGILSAVAGTVLHGGPAWTLSGRTVLWLLAGTVDADTMARIGVVASGHVWRQEKLVTMKADVVALARLIRYSEEEALRLGVSGVVVECLRMAGIELVNTIEDGISEESHEPEKAVRMN